MFMLKKKMVQDVNFAKSYNLKQIHGFFAARADKITTDLQVPIWLPMMFIIVAFILKIRFLIVVPNIIIKMWMQWTLTRVED